tara:strand:+ start:273 stop:578 length:306 start_codon:yes stop_codon:yes gene_type:complete
LDKPTTTAAIVAAVTGVFSAGAFKFYEFFLNQKRDKQVEEKAEQTLYRDDLIKRVEKLEEEREVNLQKIMELTSSMSALNVQMEYMKRDNELLKMKIDSLR